MLVITASFAQEGKSSETAEILRSLAAADALGISRRPPGPAGSRSVKFPRGRPLYEIKSAWQAPRNTGVCVLSAKLSLPVGFCSPGRVSGVRGQISNPYNAIRRAKRAGERAPLILLTPEEVLFK